MAGTEETVLVGTIVTVARPSVAEVRWLNGRRLGGPILPA